MEKFAHRRGDGTDSRCRKSAELAEALLLLLSGKASKLYFFDAKNPDKHVAVDRKTLLDPAFLTALRDGKPGVAPKEPNKWLMNRRGGEYRKAMERYQWEKALYEIKQLQQQGKELGRDLSELPEEAEIDLAAVRLEMTPELIAQVEEIRRAEEEKEQLIAEGNAVEEDFTEDKEKTEETVAEKRRQAAFKVLNRDDAGRGEVVDAIAVLLTCHMVAGKEGMENNAKLFDKAVGEVKRQPAFAEMTMEPEKVQEKTRQALEAPTGEMRTDAERQTTALTKQSKALKAENVIFREFLQTARAIKTMAPKKAPAPVPKPSVPQAAPKPKVPIPVRMLTMERRTDDGKE